MSTTSSHRPDGPESVVRRGCRRHGVLPDAATIVSTGNALVMYQEPLGITGNQIGIISAALTLGIAVGAAVGGRLGDRFGRKPVFSVTMIGIVIAMACNVFAPGFAFLLVGAILGGLCTGADLPVSHRHHRRGR